VAVASPEVVIEWPDHAVMLAMAAGFITMDKPELMPSLLGNARALRIAA